MTSKQRAIRKCNNLDGGARSECLEMVELCAAGKTTIKTDVGEVRASTVESCFEKAPKLTEMGYKIISGKAPPGAAPTPAPTQPNDEPAHAPQPQTPSDSAPAWNPGVTQMREGEMREGFCTEKTGFVPTLRAELAWIDGSPTLVIDGKPMERGEGPLPILGNRTGGLDRRVIMLPYREVHFKLGKAKPVNKSKFKQTIGRMVGDIKNVISGPFAKICGLDYLKEFAGDLTLYVVGKTDRLGTEEHNLELSEARAKAVADAMDSRKDKIASALWGGGRGLRIKYLGTGEYLTETEDEVASPDDRRVELYLSTEGPPLRGPWVEIGDSAEGADPSNYLEYYCGGADSDCKNVVAQCEASLKVMCEEAYPFSFIDRDRCVAESGAWMASGKVGDAEVKKWLNKGYFRFPIFHDRGMESAGTLKQCFRKAPAVARSHYVSSNSPSRIDGRTVSDPKAVRGKIPRGTRYCTADQGWLESSRTTITETPRGEILWYGNSSVATFGKDWITIRKGRNQTSVQPMHEVDLEGDNVVHIAKTIASELVDFILAGDFTRTCMRSGRNRVVLIEFFSDSIGVEVHSKMEEIIDVIEAILRDYEGLPKDVTIASRFNVIDPYGKHRGLFVSSSLPANYGRFEQQGTYGPGTGNGGGSSIEVVPLR